MGSISALFHPDSVAVVGATPREGAVGRANTANLLEDFVGDVVPVTSAHNEVLGVPAVDDVGETNADLAVVATPPSAVLDVVSFGNKAGLDTTDFPAITELDVNPLVALPPGGDPDADRPAVRAVDMASTVDPEAPERE
ncbi:CoA-binding protein [Haloparvum sp. AD34]